MASQDDILSTLQNGVQAVNNLKSTLAASFPAFVISGGSSTGSTTVFDNNAAVQAAQIDPTVNGIITLGYAAAADGGGGTYVRVAADPIIYPKLQSADGTWWWIPNVGTYIRQYGALGDNITDDTVAFNNAFVTLNSAVSCTLVIQPGHYLKTGTHTITANGASIVGNGWDTCFIVQNDNNDCITVSNGLTGMGGFAISNLSIYSALGWGLTFGRISGVTIDTLSMSSVNGLRIVGSDNVQASNLSILENTGFTATSSFVAGSKLLSIETHFYSSGPVYNIPSEIFISNFDIKAGSSVNVQYAGYINGGDGIFLTNGHIGSVRTAATLIEPSNVANNFVSTVLCSNVYFDGIAANGVVISGSTSNSPRVLGLQFTGCFFANFTGGIGLYNSSFPTEGLLVNDCGFLNNGRGIAVTGNEISGVLISNNVCGNNTVNTFTITTTSCSVNIPPGNIPEHTCPVAELPPVAPANVGFRRMISNSSATTFYTIPGGTGATIVPVWSDGGNWRIG